MASSAGVFYMHRVVGEHGESLAVFAAFEILTAETQRSPKNPFAVVTNPTHRSRPETDGGLASRR
jgi:hypothetical protein